MSGDKAELKCPNCGSDGEGSRFRIAATVWVLVWGSDYLGIMDESRDREYGSEDACRCKGCGHQARMGDFYKEEPAEVEYAVLQEDDGHPD